jgi:hypothetical protein
VNIDMVLSFAKVTPNRSVLDVPAVQMRIEDLVAVKKEADAFLRYR